MSNQPSSSRNGVLAWFAANRVAANMLMAVVLVTGVLSLLRMKVEVFQEFDPDIIRIEVPYPDASPGEIEEGICLRVEEAVKGIEGVKQLTSVASEGLGTVVAEIEDYADDREVLDDVKAAVDRILDFPPKDAEEPVILDVDSRIQVISVVIYGEVPLRTLKELAEQVQDELTRMDNISMVKMAGARRDEISIEVSEASLQRYRLTLTQVADAVRRSSLDLPSGSIKGEQGHVLLRAKGQRYHGPEFEDIVVLTRNDGTKLYLNQLATVVDGFEESDVSTYFDGHPAVLLKIFRVGHQGALEVAETIERYTRNRPLPEGVKMTTWFSRAEYLQGRLHLLLRNGIIGLVLVFLCLVLFLDLRLAFWTTMGIPISFTGGFILLNATGVSINMISLFALIIVLGIVVDDAIVVGENIFAHRQSGKSNLAAAITGVRQMAAPVTLTVFTTIAAFAPLVFTAGELGKILWVIPIVVTSVLLISLIEALLILPAHLTGTRQRTTPGLIARGQQRMRNTLQRFIEGPYARALARATGYRYLTLAIAVFVLLLILGLIGGGHVELRLMPEVDADNVWATLSMPQGTPVERTRTVVKHLETAADQIRNQYDKTHDGPSVFRHVSTTIGDQPFAALAGGGPGAVQAVGATASHLAEVNIELLSGELRTISSREIGRLWRQQVGDIPGISTLTFTSELFTAGEAINIQLSHHELDHLLSAAEELKQKLASFDGVGDIADSFEPGKHELQFDLTPSGQASGLTLDNVGRQVRQAFYGEEVQRIQRGRSDIKVMVRYPQQDRRSLADIDNMRLRLPDATEIPFRTAVRAEIGRGFASIKRVDRQRVVNVTANIDESIANAADINNVLHDEVLASLTRRWPGLSYTFEGEQREMAASTASLRKNQIVALLMIFAMLAVQFRSYVQPLIVMSVIPFGLVGAVLGHLVMGLDLSLLSGFGIVALTGVVVNDSLIMIDRINQQRRQGMPLRRAVLESGCQRFRPILLTTLTTFFGLTPMILERSLQAKFLIPMAVSLSFGVLVATAITLLLVPSVYLILEDLRDLCRH